MSSPAEVVQRQLEAYNAKDVDGWLSAYDSQAEQYELHGGPLAKGHDEMRVRIQARFAEPDLHAELLSRVEMGAIVVDLERITRNFPEGRGTVEMLCIYEVIGGSIAKATFALGKKVIEPDTPSVA